MFSISFIKSSLVTVIVVATSSILSVSCGKSSDVVKGVNNQHVLETTTLPVSSPVDSTLYEAEFPSKVVRPDRSSNTNSTVFEFSLGNHGDTGVKLFYSYYSIAREVGSNDPNSRNSSKLLRAVENLLYFKSDRTQLYNVEISDHFKCEVMDIPNTDKRTTFKKLTVDYRLLRLPTMKQPVLYKSQYLHDYLLSNTDYLVISVIRCLFNIKDKSDYPEIFTPDINNPVYHTHIPLTLFEDRARVLLTTVLRKYL